MNKWHVYSDVDGYFDWAVDKPLPKDVEVKIQKRWVGKYEPLETTLSIKDIERKPIVLQLAE